MVLNVVLVVLHTGCVTVVLLFTSVGLVGSLLYVVCFLLLAPRCIRQLGH